MRFHHWPVAATLLALVASTASAQVESMSVAVEGLACPFCVFGIEKKLTALPEVAGVETSLEGGHVDLALKDGLWPSLASVEEAIRKAGFRPGAIRLTAVGTLRIDEEAARLRTPGGEELLLFEDSLGPGNPLGDESRKRLEQLAADDATVAISGRAHAHVDGPPGLSLGEVERVHVTTLGIGGMESEDSATKLAAALRGLEGVHDARVDLEEQLAVVESRGDPVDVKRVLEAIQEAGFEPRPHPEGGS